MTGVQTCALPILGKSVDLGGRRIIKKQIRAFIIFIKNIIHFIELKTLIYLLLYAFGISEFLNHYIPMPFVSNLYWLRII